MTTKIVYLDTSEPKPGDVVTTADIRRAIEALEANAIPPATCESCGAKVYVFLPPGYALPS